MSTSSEWFNVDKEGLAKLLERRGPEFVLYELVSNAMDQNVRRIDVTIEPVEGKSLVRLVVEDDDPDGFKDLTHAFTLFAESGKKGDADKRGRFNLGEKLVLAMCESASISSTTGTIAFDSKGRHRGRKYRDTGSRFEGLLRMTRDDMAMLINGADRILVPDGITLTVNDGVVMRHRFVTQFETTLDTEIADDEGILRRRPRRTIVRVYEPLAGETASIFELGIPVVETGDRFHVSVEQKVPLSLDRDNVTPGYLRALRAAVLTATYRMIEPEQATTPWVRDALESKDFDQDATRELVRHRFGDKIVSYDPSDIEANNIAVAKGYVVVHGGQMSKAEWDNARSAGAIRAAGQVTPSPKPFSPDGTPLKVIPVEEWTPWMARIADYAERLALRTIRTAVDVTFTNDRNWKFAASYGAGSLTLKLASGVVSEDQAPAMARSRIAGERLDALLIHEFAHHVAPNHLSEQFYDECCRIGAAAKAWVSE